MKSTVQMTTIVYFVNSFRFGQLTFLISETTFFKKPVILPILMWTSDYSITPRRNCVQISNQTCSIDSFSKSMTSARGFIFIGLPHTILLYEPYEYYNICKTSLRLDAPAAYSSLLVLNNSANHKQYNSSFFFSTFLHLTVPISLAKINTLHGNCQHNGSLFTIELHRLGYSVQAFF